MQAVIGLTRGARPPAMYRHALEAAGACVVEIEPALAAQPGPEAEALLGGLCALVLSGGGDIAPEFYGAALHPAVRREPGRDELEIALARAALATGLPLLGICRGIQVLNVAAGGTLWQDLPTQCPAAGRHMEPEEGRDRRRLLHEVQVESGTLAAQVLGAGRLPVNSIHHQAVREVAAGLRVAARARDGIVEALEAPGHPFALAVQWHPEELSATQERQAALFAALVEAARLHPGPSRGAGAP